ncbi:MAG: aminodeoxychorismate synthase component I [Spirochaetales bacterium]|nr:aminodeoxychorismate synthase component I [Spirochaetales bacterium]
METLKFDTTPSRSLLFHDPVKVLKTYQIDEVEAVLCALDDYIEQGYYAAGFIAFEAGFAFTPRLKKLIKKDRSDFPLVWLGIYKQPRIYDYSHQMIKHGERIPAAQYASIDGAIETRMDFTGYQKKIDEIKKFIRRGDTYQINFTWNTHFSLSGSAYAFYNEVKNIQPVSYAAYIDTGQQFVLSFSPELFFTKVGNKIVTKPMKGTIRRGMTSDEDEKLKQQLFTSEKNRAENLMIVDLLRNDLGRICEPGSVTVEKLFEIESYRTLFQMTSTISGQLKVGTSYFEIFKGLFPCGSVTGAPKIRSMEIIRELETEDRGVYTGAIGYISPTGKSVFNVAIRTPIIYNQNGTMGIGSGIVWDSAADEEYEESLLKMNFLTQKQQDFQIYESMLWENGEYFLLDYHMERIAESAHFFSFEFSADDFCKALSENKHKLNGNTCYKVKISVSRHGRFAVTNEEIVQTPQDEVLIGIAKQKVSSDNRFLYHKTTRRHMYDQLLKTGRAKGLWDVVMQNERGEITEGCRSNIFIKDGGKMITPPVSCGLLAGTMRRHILESNPQAEEGIITVNRLRGAGQIFMCNSVRKIVNVKLAVEDI